MTYSPRTSTVMHPIVNWSFIIQSLKRTQGLIQHPDITKCLFPPLFFLFFLLPLFLIRFPIEGRGWPQTCDPLTSTSYMLGS